MKITRHLVAFPLVAVTGMVCLTLLVTILPTKTYATTALSDLMVKQAREVKSQTQIQQIAPAVDTKVIAKPTITQPTPNAVPTPMIATPSPALIELIQPNSVLGEFATDMSATISGSWTLGSPQKSLVDGSPVWGWLQRSGSNSTLGTATAGSTGSIPDVFEYSSDTQTSAPLTGIIAQMFGSKMGLVLSHLGLNGFQGRAINLITGPISHLSGAQYQSPSNTQAAFALSNDRLGVTYFTYDLDRAETAQPINIEAKTGVSDWHSNTQQLLLQIESKMQATPGFLESIQAWAKNHPDAAINQSILALLKSGELSHPILEKQLSDNSIDFTIINPAGELAPTVYGEKPLPQATWGGRPLSVQMTAVNRQAPSNNKAEFVITTLSENNQNTVLIATYCSVRVDTTGLKVAECTPGTLLAQFPQGSQIKLSQSSTAQGRFAQAVTERTATGTEKLWVMRFTITEVGQVGRARLWPLQETTQHIGDVSVAALSEQEYFMSKIIDNRLTVDYVLERMETPRVTTVASVPSTQVGQTEVHRENNHLVVSFSTGDNQRVYAAHSLIQEQR